MIFRSSSHRDVPPAAKNTLTCVGTWSVPGAEVPQLHPLPRAPSYQRRAPAAREEMQAARPPRTARHGGEAERRAHLRERKRWA
jgi:hypothetical protein